MIGGGADVINQYLAAGHVDELELHVVPLLLGGGARLFEGIGPDLGLGQIQASKRPASRRSRTASSKAAWPCATGSGAERSVSPRNSCQAWLSRKSGAVRRV